MIVLQFNKQRSKSLALWLVILLTPGVLRSNSSARLTYAILPMQRICPIAHFRYDAGVKVTHRV